MFTGFKHFHVLLVILFVLTTLIKLILLFVNEKKFDNYRAKTKFPEIIVTILFLISGIGMIVLKNATFHSLFWVKIGLIFVAIPLAIVGFKKKKKIPALIGAFLFVMIYGVAEMSSKKAVIVQANTAEESYKANCVVCHGDAGDKKLGGASDLSKSTMTEAQIKQMIENGSKKMPNFSTLENIQELSEYVKTLSSK